jgi:hypothetical protein
MTTVHQDRAAGLSRRDILKHGCTAGALMALVVSGGAILSADRAWGMKTGALTPQTMATLIQLARDIYPHDQVADKYYAIAMKSHEVEAAKSEAHRVLIEQGVADLDRRAGPGGYRNVGWEESRVAILRTIETTPFFQAVRSGLVVGLYNQQAIWPIFGYEGESYSKGGYIDRGFNDIDWL